MRLFLALLLLFTVLSNELVSTLDIDGMDNCHLELSYEGESEKESSENIEDFIKIQFENNSNISLALCDKSFDIPELTWSISTPYLEIHSPPPDFN